MMKKNKCVLNLEKRKFYCYAESTKYGWCKYCVRNNSNSGPCVYRKHIVFGTGLCENKDAQLDSLKDAIKWCGNQIGLKGVRQMKKEKYKVVGIPIAAPTWAKWMAFDADGQLFFYEKNIKIQCGMHVLEVISPFCRVVNTFCINVPYVCSNPDWWKGTKREIDASSGVVYIYIKAPVWAKWMAFNSAGALCVYDKIPNVNDYMYASLLNSSVRLPSRGIWGDPSRDKCHCIFIIQVPGKIQDPNWWKKTLRRI